MSKSQIIIRADVSHDVGTGHIVRIIELIKLLKKKFKIVIISKYKDIFLWKIKNCKILKYSDNLMLKFYVSNQKLTFLFDLNFKKISNIEKKIISKIKVKHKTIFFDDKITKPLKNQINIIPYQLKYKKFNKYSNLLYGPKFSIFKDEIIKVSKKKYKKKNFLIVCMGGSDPYNLTFDVMNEIKNIELIKNFEIKVIVGKLYQRERLNKLSKFKINNKKIKIYQNPKNIYKIFAQSKLAIINNGNLKYEMCALKVPFILISNDKHTNQFSKYFSKNFKCFFNERKNTQVKSVKKYIDVALKNEKKLSSNTKNNFTKINLYSKYEIAKEIKNLENNSYA